MILLLDFRDLQTPNVWDYYNPMMYYEISCTRCGLMQSHLGQELRQLIFNLGGWLSIDREIRLSHPIFKITVIHMYINIYALSVYAHTHTHMHTHTHTHIVLKTSKHTSKISLTSLVRLSSCWF